MLLLPPRQTAFKPPAYIVRLSSKVLSPIADRHKECFLFFGTP